MCTNAMKISGYFSHPIRGLKGDAATVSDMELNNTLASKVAAMIQEGWAHLLELYVPADHDEYVLEYYLRQKDKKVAEHEILEIDKIILGRRDIMIAFCYNGVISKGMRVEIDHANDIGIPVFMFEKITEIPELIERVVDWYYNKQLE